MISLSNLPKTWDELVSLKNEISSRDIEIARFSDDELFYKTYQKIVPKKLRFEILLTTLENNDVKILRNAFPYNQLIKNIPEKIGHFLLWSQIGELNSQTIESEIKKVFPTQDYFWFENSPEVKSIPEIWHCHIFVKLS